MIVVFYRVRVFCNGYEKKHDRLWIQGYVDVSESLFKQKTAYELSLGLVGSDICIRDRPGARQRFFGKFIGVSSNGRTSGSGSEGRGSIPCTPAHAGQMVTGR